MGVSTSGAYNKANQAEQWNNSQINRATDQINSIYNSASRQNQINDFLDASRSYYRQNLDKQNQAAQRSLKFSMARNGLTGGSAAVDANNELGQTYQNGILSADRMAQQAAQNLRSAYDESRLNLISLAQNGMDMTTAGSRAANSLSSNLSNANSQLSLDSLGGLFSGVANIAATSKSLAEQRRSMRDYYGGLYGGAV